MSTRHRNLEPDPKAAGKKLAFQHKPFKCPSCSNTVYESNNPGGKGSRKRYVVAFKVGGSGKPIQTLGWVCTYCGWYEMYYTWKKGKMVVAGDVDFSNSTYTIGDYTHKHGKGVHSNEEEIVWGL